MDRRLLVIPAALLLALGWWLLPSEQRAPTPAEIASTSTSAPLPPLADRDDPQDDPQGAPGEEPPPTDLPEQDEPTEASAIDRPATQVICEMGPGVPDGQAYLAVGGHSDLDGRLVQVVDGRAYLPFVYDLGPDSEPLDVREGVFSLEGYGPVAVQWTDRPEAGHGSCTAPIEPELGTASLTGSITLAGSGEPAEGAWLEGCGNLSFADGQGVVHMDIVPEPCSVVAMRQDGLLRTMSERVEVVPVPGRDVLVDIEIPAVPRGGLGVRVTATDEGIVVEGLIDGGPAEGAGLAAGDLVVEVDGEQAIDLDLAEFVDAVGGDAGTEVEVVVDRGGERLAFTIVREALSAG